MTDFHKFTAFLLLDKVYSVFYFVSSNFPYFGGLSTYVVQKPELGTKTVIYVNFRFIPFDTFRNFTFLLLTTASRENSCGTNERHVTSFSKSYFVHLYHKNEVILLFRVIMPVWKSLIHLVKLSNYYYPRYRSGNKTSRV